MNLDQIIDSLSLVDSPVAEQAVNLSNKYKQGLLTLSEYAELISDLQSEQIALTDSSHDIELQRVMSALGAIIAIAPSLISL
jgi:hypothetical protein